jgi:hypothetical protein
MFELVTNHVSKQFSVPGTLWKGLIPGRLLIAVDPKQDLSAVIRPVACRCSQHLKRGMGLSMYGQHSAAIRSI